MIIGGSASSAKSAHGRMTSGCARMYSSSSASSLYRALAAMRKAPPAADLTSSSANASRFPQFVALDLAGRGLRQLVDELDPARVLVRRDAALHELLQLLRKRVAAGLAVLQQDECLRLRELVLVLHPHDPALEDRRVLHERGLDLRRRDPLARDLQIGRAHV